MPVYMMFRANIGKYKKVANLRQYKCSIIGQLTPDELDLMRRCFDEADADKDGMLSLQEWHVYREKATTAWRRIYGGGGC